MAYELVASDTGSKLVVTCKDNDTKAVIDLTGATVKLKYSISGGALQTKTMTVQTPATNGKAEYQFLAGELSAGAMQAEVEITDATGKIITSLDLLTIPIRARL